MKHVTDLFTKNIGIKILSAVIAIVIWLVIVNIEDPEKSKVYTIPVRIENADYMESQGKAYEVVKGTDEISFTVSAKRSVIEELTRDDFTAVADMKDINMDTGEVPITVTSSKFSNRLEYSNRDQYLQVMIEDIQTLTLPVVVIPNGTVAENCIISTTDTNPEKIEVSGAESILANVSGAQVTIDVSGASDTVQKKEAVILVDENGDEIEDTDGLKLNRRKVKVTVSVVMSRQLEIRPEITGKPAKGYTVSDTYLSRDYVTVTGDASILEDLEFLNLESPQLDVTGRTSDLNAALNLTEFLPAGLTLAEGESPEMKITVSVTKKE